MPGSHTLSRWRFALPKQDGERVTLPGMDRAQVRRDLSRKLTSLDRQLGARWTWGTQIRSIREVCGIAPGAEDDVIRERFTAHMRAILPAGEYDRATSYALMDELLDAVFSFHALPPPPGPRRSTDRTA